MAIVSLKSLKAAAELNTNALDFFVCLFLYVCCVNLINHFTNIQTDYTSLLGDDFKIAFHCISNQFCVHKFKKLHCNICS